MSLNESMQNSNYQMNDVYKVYWLHLEEHNDLKNQGYIGITKQPVEDRFYKHCWDAEKDKADYSISRAIRKYGKENIVVDTLCICEEDYAKNLEYKLRPKPRIGWNIVEGGQSGNGEFMKEMWKDPDYKERVVTTMRKNYTPEFLASVSERFTNMHADPNSAVNTEEYKKNRAERVASWLEDPEIMERKSKAISKTQKMRFEEGGPWIHPNINHEVWGKADQVFYEWFKGRGDVGHKTLARHFGFNIGSLGGMIKRFREGWQPHLDSGWLDFYKGGQYE